jgi:hypothetical protein
MNRRAARHVPARLRDVIVNVLLKYASRRG